ncbi:restriction endonuclease subunit S [Vibrio rotiferianus]|uniref:restriction endonuclease subunit S n=1 Tax=Vibrio rotiferianus TaxID=190895 RepID=UPI00390907F9
MSWPLVKLGEVAKLINGDRGKNYPSKGSFVEKGIPFINAGCLSNEHTLIDEELNFITEEKFDSLRSGKIEKGDILFCLRGSLGKFALVDTNMKGAIASSLVIIRANEKVYIDYLKHYLGSLLCQREIQAYENGAAQPNLSATDLKSFQIPLPPLEEQKRIAAILDKADAIRQKRKQAIDLADEFLRSVFLDMFGDPVTNPKGWEVKTFGSVIDTLTDYHANGSYKTLNENVTLLDEPNYAYMVRTTDLEKRNYVDGVKYIDKHAYEHLSKSKVFGGEIIVNKIGSAGALYLMPKLNRPVSLAMNQFMVRCKEGHLNEFYFHQLCTNAGTSEIQKRVQGAVTKTITKNALREVPVMCPSEEKQQGFVKIVEAFNSNLLCDLKEAYRVSCEAFDSLSLKAFSGQL